MTCCIITLIVQQSLHVFVPLCFHTPDFHLMFIVLSFVFQDGFVEFFRVADPESTVRNTLMAFAGFAGIGATLALLIR